MSRWVRTGEPELSDYHPTSVDHDFLDPSDDHGTDDFGYNDVNLVRADGRSAKSHRRLHCCTASGATGTR
jgi:hypothetical protein